MPSKGSVRERQGDLLTSTASSNTQRTIARSLLPPVGGPGSTLGRTLISRLRVSLVAQSSIRSDSLRASKVDLLKQPHGANEDTYILITR